MISRVGVGIKAASDLVVVVQNIVSSGDGISANAVDDILSAASRMILN
jgi:hypothetical protein